MKLKLKNIAEQIIVITGASSGIGLTTAKMAAERGAKVVLAARDEPSLTQAVEEIRAKGGQAMYVLADVAEPDAVRTIAEAAKAQFGGFDTWVNNAAVPIYGLIKDVPLEDARRLFDVNYWGVVQGSLVAIEHLRERGGALINIGSIVSDRAVPLQGHYSASKHAVKGFTDTLRMELEKESAPIAVTLIKPGSIATPYIEHAKNYMDAEPDYPPPVYAPEVVADAILHCAQRPMRELTVGGGGGLIAGMGSLMPRLTDRYMEAALFDQQKSARRAIPGRRGNLYAPMPGRERTEVDRHVMESSLYTQAALHPTVALVGLAAVALGVALAVQRRS